jgi:hypothetical protein
VFGTSEPAPYTTSSAAHDDDLIVLAVSGVGLRN